jgi:hypothetical protein
MMMKPHEIPLRTNSSWNRMIFWSMSFLFVFWMKTARKLIEKTKLQLKVRIWNFNVEKSTIVWLKWIDGNKKLLQFSSIYFTNVELINVEFPIFSFLLRIHPSHHLSFRDIFLPLYENLKAWTLIWRIFDQLLIFPLHKKKKKKLKLRKEKNTQKLFK